MLATGSLAPDFTLPDDTGSRVRLRDLLDRGRPVVLMFYPADHTPVCTKEACMVRDLVPPSAASGSSATVVGISRQGSDSKASFRAKHALTHILLADERGEVAALYKSRGFFGLPLPFGTMRVTYLIGADGRIVEGVHSEFDLRPHEQLLRRALGGSPA